MNFIENAFNKNFVDKTLRGGGIIFKIIIKEGEKDEKINDFKYYDFSFCFLG